MRVREFVLAKLSGGEAFVALAAAAVGLAAAWSRLGTAGVGSVVVASGLVTMLVRPSWRGSVLIVLAGGLLLLIDRLGAVLGTP